MKYAKYAFFQKCLETLFWAVQITLSIFESLEFTYLSYLSYVSVVHN